MTTAVKDFLEVSVEMDKWRPIVTLYAAFQTFRGMMGMDKTKLEKLIGNARFRMGRRAANPEEIMKYCNIFWVTSAVVLEAYAHHGGKLSRTNE